MNPATDYVDDWRHFDFVEDAVYDSTHGDGPDRFVTGLKAKLGDLNAGDYQGFGGQLAVESPTLTCLLWPVDQPDLDLRINAELHLAESGPHVIRARTKDRFGRWNLIVQPTRTDDLGPS